MLDELCEGSGVNPDDNFSLPQSERPERTADVQKFLDNLYEKTDGSVEAKLKRCCRFLGMEPPRWESGVELDGSYRVMEAEAIRKYFREAEQPVP
jgi:hypothetical protein